MICFSHAVVDGCISYRHGLQELAVTLSNGEKARAYYYTEGRALLAIGSRVILNTTAVDLKLGTGGYHYVYSVTECGGEKDDAVVHGVSTPHQGHLMKLRYTPLQRAVLAVEEAASPHHHMFTQNLDLQGMPVLIGELHSMLPMAVAWLRYVAEERMGDGSPASRSLKIAYVATDGGALPLVMSNHVVALDKLNWLQGTITYGHAYGGDLEAMNKFTALLAAKYSLQADITIVCMGPGIAGTGTMLGHTGIEVGELVNAVSILNGRPIVIPRLSEADSRPRHQGLSHHTVISLSTIALRTAELPLPYVSSTRLQTELEKQIEEANIRSQHHITWHHPPTIEEMSSALVEYPLNLTSMGRTLAHDPVYYQGICVAAAQALKEYNTKI